MHPYVRKLHRANEYYFKEGCYIIEVSNTDQDSGLNRPCQGSGRSTDSMALADRYL